jgi:hypothetical protein
MNTEYDAFWTILCRESGLQCSTRSSDDPDICAVCLERACNVAAEGLFFLSLNLSRFSLCWSLGPQSSLLAMLPWTFICSWFFRKHLFSFHQYKCHSFRRCTYLSNIIFLTGRKEIRFNASAYRRPMKNVIDLSISIYFGSGFYFHYLWAQSCQCIHIYNCCIFLRTYYICCI